MILMCLRIYDSKWFASLASDSINFLEKGNPKLEKSSIVILILIACFTSNASSSSSVTLSGNVGYETRAFINDSGSVASHHISNSISFSPEVYWERNNEKFTFLFSPFLRIDQRDPDRTHIDIREFTYSINEYDWELRLGVRKLFWGVAESNHLVDVINQTDSVENLDLEDKLGQPMVNLAFLRDWGSIDLFVLPLFRERTFVGVEGRPNFSSIFRGKEAEFESAAERNHVDFAIRYSTYTDNLDLGFYHFWGTARTPRIVTRVREGNLIDLVPFYEIAHQTGLDAQLTYGNTLYKLELLHYSSDFGSYFAGVGGGEYTLVGIGETSMDLGILAEYHWDERGTSGPSIFNHDLFGGVRLAANDVNDTQLLAGLITDINNRSTMLNLEASRRLSNFWKVEIEVRFFVDASRNDPSYGLRNEDYIQLEFFRYF